jgi:hypothetical protein
MQLICVFIVFLEMSITIYAKNYSAVEANRLRIKALYQNNLLTRPLMKNINQTIVAIGLGIIEVAGIDPRTQVGINEIRIFCFLKFLFRLLHSMLILN